MKSKSFLHIGLLLLCCSGCYVSKTLDVKKSVFILDDFQTEIKASEISKYIYNASTFDYRDRYLLELEKALATSNIFITEKGSEADYVLEVKAMTCKEHTVNQAIKDSTSAQHGEKYVLHHCNIQVESIFYRGYMEKKLKSWNIGAGKDEKITNNRNLNQMISMENTEGTVYRYITLSDSVFYELCEKAGQRTSANISQQIAKD